MTISYKWLKEYLPVEISAERLSTILTSIGLEVESKEDYVEYKGGLQGLIIGEVLTCAKHPNADKLSLTTVNTGGERPLHIVCGAPNVAAGQKVVVAPVGTTIYPAKHEPITMKLAKIRGEESEGMICAEDEIGMGDSHDGILVLPDDAPVGMAAAEYFGVYTDTIFEIGLTPNRMDAMSHWGVARDVCAYLSHHDGIDVKARIPETQITIDTHESAVTVAVENVKDCPRYSGISIHHLKIGPSPKWMQQRLKAIGLRPINNIVDITNFIQHETGQPLHAFDEDKIKGAQVIVKNLPDGTVFVTLDEKERKLSQEDLMICDTEGGMCIAGVFGGLDSGVTDHTKNVFLESAYFNPISLRKTSFRHGLRTDAAMRFEKGTDISNTVTVLTRAAQLIKEICGGQIASEVIDVYPTPAAKKEVKFTYEYLKKLSGKEYAPETVKKIVTGLGFGILEDKEDYLLLTVPYHKPDISLPADIVEEVLRIDGLDNVAIPSSITITPAIDENIDKEILKEKISNYLVGIGYYEILTNSISSKAYFDQEELKHVVKMKNSLNADLNIMRPNMLETGLEVIAHNLNHKNENLKLYEFGKTYAINDNGGFDEPEHLCLYLSGEKTANSWKSKAIASDFYTIKGAVASILQHLGISQYEETAFESGQYEYAIKLSAGEKTIGTLGAISKLMKNRFDIKAPVFFADLNWEILIEIARKQKVVFKPISRFPSVQRDLAMIVPKTLAYSAVEKAVSQLKLNKLQSVQLFDVFESEKLGVDKKSLAVNFIFMDAEKTLTDKEIDGWMSKIMQSLEKDLSAEIRK